MMELFLLSKVIWYFILVVVILVSWSI